jgi:hypothetical protein
MSPCRFPPLTAAATPWVTALPLALRRELRAISPPHAVGAIWPGAPRVRAASIASGERERNEVDGEATRKDKEEEKKRRKERKREIKKEIFYLILDIVIPKFYFAYYYYISKIEYDSYIN